MEGGGFAFWSRGRGDGRGMNLSLFVMERRTTKASPLLSFLQREGERDLFPGPKKNPTNAELCEKCRGGNGGGSNISEGGRERAMRLLLTSVLRPVFFLFSWMEKMEMQRQHKKGGEKYMGQISRVMPQQIAAGWRRSLWAQKEERTRAKLFRGRRIRSWTLKLQHLPLLRGAN